VVELDWVVFDMKKQSVVIDRSIFINSVDNAVSTETQRVTGVTQNKLLSEGVSFEEAIN
jgi:hypothetical protein